MLALAAAFVITSKLAAVRPALWPISKTCLAVSAPAPPSLLKLSVAFSTSSACLVAISATIDIPLITPPNTVPNIPKFLPRLQAASPAFFIALLYFSKPSLPDNTALVIDVNAVVLDVAALEKLAMASAYFLAISVLIFSASVFSSTPF